MVSQETNMVAKQTVRTGVKELGAERADRARRDRLIGELDPV